MRNALQKGLSKPSNSNLTAIRSQNDTSRSLEMQQNRNKILATVTNPGMILQATTHATGSPVSPQRKEKIDNEAAQNVENPERE